MSNKPSISSCHSLVIATRSSPLALAQTKEVELALQHHYPGVSFQITRIARETPGDRDQTISLRTLDKTDFFTRDLDELVLSRQCDIAIHSAKDLPEPLPDGLTVIALTQCIDSTDALVLKPRATMDSLASGAVIATSSKRREEVVRGLRQDLQFVDLRGSVDQRIDLLNAGKVDGVVVATAALKRLGLMELNHLILDGVTAEHQGRLAIVARKGNQNMRDLFACLDTR